MSEPKTKTVAVIGAGGDPARYANKSVRAHLKAGYTVYPVHPGETIVEGLRVFRSIRDVPEPLDRVTVYIPPGALLAILPDIAAKEPREVFFKSRDRKPRRCGRRPKIGA